MTETDICNIALGKLSGAGDALNGNPFIGSINSRNKVSTFCKFTFPRVRRKSIVDLAARKSPFRETVRFLDLGAELDSTPEIGAYEHAFNLPEDHLAIVSQFDEDSIDIRFQPADYNSPEINITYQFETIANAAGNGTILLTNVLSNTARDSAFIEYVVDITSVNAFSENMIEVIATLLASELSPVVGRDIETRQAMLAEYEQLAIPNAIKANQTQLNNSARPISNYNGGRASTLQVT